MLDNDNLTYSYQRRMVGNNAERALITLERSQKLDLLLHLLANLQQSLIVCGPEGIGKTTLLETVRQSRKDLWEVVVLPASANSSFESLVGDLLRCLNLTKASAFDLSALRELCVRQKVVLLIDDAGNLVPGLITMLMEFAESLPGLRLVFAMNHDQFHIKSGTDKLVEECHFIELPPLSKKQCGEYLQNLSAQPGAVISFSAINDNLIDQLYRDTHGIPGKILAELPKLAEVQSRKSGKLGLWLAVVSILAASGFAAKSFLPADLFEQPTTKLAEAEAPQGDSTQAVTATPPAPEVTVPEPEPVSPVAIEQVPASATVPVPAVEPAAALVTQAAAPVAAATPAPVAAAVVRPEPAASAPVSPTASEKPQVDLQPEAPIEQPIAPLSKTSAETKPSEPAPEATPATAKIEPEPQPEATPPKAEPSVAAPPTVPVAKPVERKPAKPISEGGDRDWIMAQPAGNYTLQVMVLSNKTSVLRFLKKYAEYGDGLKYYPINSGEQEKYVLIYGSFASAAEAQQLKASLPGEFKQALEKRFRAVQKESRH